MLASFIKLRKLLTDYTTPAITTSGHRGRQIKQARNSTNTIKTDNTATLILKLVADLRALKLSIYAHALALLSEAVAVASL